MKQAIATSSAPGAIGPYSQAVRAGGLLFLSGQIPLDPATGQIVTGDVSAQTQRVIDNLREVLAASGCGYDDVVKTTIYLVDLTQFAAVNEVYGRAFRSPFPARATVEVSALPRGAQVEIDAIAVIPDGGAFTPRA
jgi:2-iminobutanoate/2-iminopropanoate deaminase